MPRTTVASRAESPASLARLLPAALALPFAAALLSGCTAGAVTPSPAPSAAVGDPGGDLGSAAETALEQVGSGIVISVEKDDDGTAWEVVIAADDGSETDVKVSAKDASIIGSPSPQTTDADDAAENVHYLQWAKIDFSDAAKAASVQSKGVITEVKLDDEDGTVIWQVELVEGSTTHEVKLDAGTGDLYRAPSGAPSDG
ncbi:PepSY domain-containing protein [Schumannella soli]|uniref:PepSY domain-containing protein n=1 Tax=Schumannella soli TaxID=2590779 RepID=A0A506XWV5_9MICO|nr:PepSY domain-containing protein [Schumannella soli]TPW77384.1 hypothetical protein FJ657_01470 [Schumannella soli]